MKTRIMYIEYKGEGLSGDARIGRVKFSKTMKSVRYQGKTLEPLRGRGFKANFADVVTDELYWISGCRKDGADRLYGERKPIYIDEDVQEEYWTVIREQPEMVGTLVRNG